MEISDIRVEEYTKLANIFADLIFEFQGLYTYMDDIPEMSELSIKVVINNNNYRLNFTDFDANFGIFFDEIRNMSVKEIRTVFYEIREKLEVIKLRALAEELRGQL